MSDNVFKKCIEKYSHCVICYEDDDYKSRDIFCCKGCGSSCCNKCITKIFFQSLDTNIVCPICRVSTIATIPINI